MRSKLVYIVIFLALYGCSEKKKNLHHLKFSSPVERLLNDTTSYGLIVDSLRNELKNAHTDLLAVDLLNNLSFNWKGEPIKLFAEEATRQSKAIKYDYGRIESIAQQGYYFYWIYQDDSALIYYNKALKLANENGFEKIQAQVLNYLGDVNRIHNNYATADSLYRKSAQLAAKLNDQYRLCQVYSVIADIFRLQSQQDSSFHYYNLSLELAIKIGDQRKMAFCYAYLGDNLRLNNKYVNALDLTNKALHIAEKVGDINLVAYSKNNLADIYRKIQEPEKAFTYYNDVIQLAKKINDYSTYTTATLALGELCMETKQYRKAYYLYKDQIEASQKANDNIVLVMGLIAMGESYRNRKDIVDSSDYYHQQAEVLSKKINFRFGLCRLNIIKGYKLHDLGKYNEAIIHVNQALQVAKEIEDGMQLREAYRMLMVCNSKLGNYKSAYQNSELWHQLKDSLNSVDQIRKFATTEFKYVEQNLKEKHLQQVMVHKAEKAQKDEEIKRQRFMRNTFIGGFVLIALFSVVLYRSLKANKRAKQIIEHQKEIVEEKQKEIIDSIKYARRIQSALLPPDKYLERFFKRFKE